MNVRNCRKCGKLFNYVAGLPLCPACKEKAEESFQVVKKFIRENPRADIREVAAACEVETSQIQQWIREEDSPSKLPCENCGTMIRAGKYCEKCKAIMAKNLSSAIDKPKVIAQQRPDRRDTQSRMRFLDKHE